MKKKKDRFLHVFQLVLAGVFVILLIWAIGKRLNQEPTFTIYEEVCENETYLVYDHRNFSRGSLMETIAYLKIGKYTRYDDLGCDILEEHGVLNSFIPCTLLNEELVELNEIVAWLFDGGKLPSNVEEKQREVCEQVEVEEIFLGKCKGGFEQVDEPDGLTKHILMCSQENCEYMEEINWSFCTTDYDFIIMEQTPKKDLTIEWLDGNCEFIESCEKIDSDWYCTIGFKDGDLPLQKYSCFDKYTVGVKQ